MQVRRKVVIAAGAAVVLAAGGVGIANAVAGSDGEGGATGPDAQRAEAAALRLIPGGTANAVERDSENGATWEVEVRRPDGSTVDVRLDERFNLVVAEPDSDGR
ncbi:MAG TPA: hypothetical protein VGP78_05455 [Solirubrobacteraceae bacterium]|jgi:hypothetical protein|nr:hypothetical protein [Solirubrobacteraceae bacterium]